MSLQIRKADLEEAAIVHAIMLDAFEAYRHDVPPTSALNETIGSIRDAMEKGETAILCFKNGKAVGSVRYLIRDGLYFHRLAVRKEEQGQGIGTAMVRWLEDDARRSGQGIIWLKVRCSQPRNIGWYSGLGYLRTDESEDINPDGHLVRTVRMSKALPR